MRKIIHLMRKRSQLLSALFNPTLQAVLGAMVLQPEREWYLSDLAAFLGVGPSSIQRTLGRLSDAGILLRRRSGNRVYYRADPVCPILPELAGILVKTAGIAEPLRSALLPLAARIRVAFIHGSIAELRERSESDVDLIIVGDVPSADVALALRPLQARIGRAVNFTRYAPAEFASKMAAGHGFLTAVLGRERIFLIGDERELEQAAGRASRGRRAHHQARAG